LLRQQENFEKTPIALEKKAACASTQSSLIFMNFGQKSTAIFCLLRLWRECGRDFI